MSSLFKMQSYNECRDVLKDFLHLLFISFSYHLTFAYLFILVPFTALCLCPPSPGQQVIEEQRRRLAELKQKAAAEAQCQWEALHGSHMQLSSSPAPPLVHHSILHHTAPSAGEDNYDTLSLESSDSIDTSVSTSNNSACSPDNMSRFDTCFYAPLSETTAACVPF